MNDLIRNLNDFVSENFPVDKVTPFLTDYDLKSDVIEKYCFFKDDKYSRNLIYKDEHFELLIVCWDSGQKAPIHGHEGEKCWMKVEKGSLQVCNYQLESMNPLSLTMIDRIDGIAGFLDGPADIHSVENIQDEPAISLHLYTKPFEECDIYCIDKGTIERMPLVYDSIYMEIC